MKICRFVSSNGEEFYGLYNPSQPDEAVVMEGDLYGEKRVTDRVEKIKRYLPPVEPVTIFALGMNYGKHALETGAKLPFIPVVFMKAITSAIGHRESILLPAAGPEQVDYEGELAIVIGKKGKNIRPSDVYDYVLGYTCANDVSARDWQMDKARGQKGQWVRGKSFDTFCPMGPALVTKEDVPNPNGLRLKTFLNDRLVQETSTNDMIFKLEGIISDLSRSVTLLPGTVILTGTPEGVGYTRQPPLFLRDGDEVVVDIENIGRLSNAVRYEAAVS